MKTFLFAFALLVSVVCHAQQEPLYSQYMFNMVNINPGYAGSRNVLSVVALHRNQWANNVAGAPNTTSLSADMPVLNDKVGIGLSVARDEIGRFKNNLVNVMAAYRLKTDRKGTLGMGISAGVNFFNAALSGIRSNTQGTSDPLYQDYSRAYPMLGAGFFYNRDKWYVGLSAPNLLETSEAVTSEEKGVFRNFQHLYLTGGYVFGITDEVYLKPSVMLRMASGAPLSMDINANLWLHEIIGIGVSYRIDNAVMGLLEIQATPQLRFGYAIDYPTIELSNDNGNTPLTHEFLLRYEFGFQKKNVVSPRYF